MTLNISEQESFFNIDELFFSRTDTRGVILSGNSVFQRVSEYAWGELLHKAHNVIRHPDMPRGVFYVLWDNLKKGKPIAAYVKNRSKNGKFYWVYALVLPIDDYFLSIRIKPTSPIFKTIESEYKKILDCERNQKINPHESSLKILEDLNNIGFFDYESFMTHALITEMTSRKIKLNLGQSIELNSLDQMLKITNQIEKSSNEIGDSFKKNSYVPLNLEIQTMHIGEDGASIGVVANKYNEMSSEARWKILEFQKTCVKVRERVHRCQINLASCELINEVIIFFKSEKDVGPINTETELFLLTKLRDQYTDITKIEIQCLRDEFSAFLNSCQHLKTLSSGLEIVRITGRVEAARIPKQKQIDDLIKQLTDFLNLLNNSLNTLELNGRAFRDALSALDRI